MAQKKMWGGRFAQDTAKSVEDYTRSVDFDRRLYAEDILGSKAHARMLARQGIIAGHEAEALVRGLDQVRAEIESGAFKWRPELEDVHMNIEARLTEIVGPVGGKLHTARSRNDQVALDMRLHVAARLDDWARGLKALVAVLVELSKGREETVMPGLTHLQPAQPVSLAHHLLAYAWMLKRDCERVGQALVRVRVSPLGAAALAGTTFDLDPESAARELGFAGVFKNSLDAVSDRDFVIEAVFCACLAMSHLSRLCEEIVLWANPCFGFVRLPDAFATGSSIMPQKRNPDVCELMRGRTARVYGGLMALLALVKGLPLAYNRDLQEDKEPFFATDDILAPSLAIMVEMLPGLEFFPRAMARAAEQGYLNATELADYLAARGLPFREAHHAAGRAVALAEGRGQGLADLGLDELKAICPLVEGDVFEVLSLSAALRRRTSPGGTGPDSAARQARELLDWLGRDG
ncbi:MAG: argininosuccinate lyase [Desulfovibrionaceae bacterium]|nr:argininosuccinate lyase [Desulfovibrionaceae bacterium]